MRSSSSAWRRVAWRTGSATWSSSTSSAEVAKSWHQPATARTARRGSSRPRARLHHDARPGRDLEGAQRVLRDERALARQVQLRAPSPRCRSPPRRAARPPTASRPAGRRRRCGSDPTTPRAGGAPSSTRSSSRRSASSCCRSSCRRTVSRVLLAGERVRQRGLELAQRHALLGDHGGDRELRLGDGLGQDHERAAARLDAREAAEAEARVLRAELDPARLGLGRHGRPRLEPHRRERPRPGRRLARRAARRQHAHRPGHAHDRRRLRPGARRRAGGAAAGGRARGSGLGARRRTGSRTRGGSARGGGRAPDGPARRDGGGVAQAERRLRLRRAPAQRRGAHRVRRPHHRPRRLHVLAERPADLARRLRPLDERAHLLGQLAQREGLEQEGVGAGPDHGADARLRAHRRERDERHRLEPRHGAQRAQQALAVHVGHQDVAHHAVGLDLAPRARARPCPWGTSGSRTPGARNARSSSRRTFGSSSTTIIRRGVVISWLASARDSHAILSEARTGCQRAARAPPLIMGADVHRRLGGDAAAGQGTSGPPSCARCWPASSARTACVFRRGGARLALRARVARRRALGRRRARREQPRQRRLQHLREPGGQRQAARPGLAAAAPGEALGPSLLRQPHHRPAPPRENERNAVGEAAHVVEPAPAAAREVRLCARVGHGARDRSRGRGRAR